MGTSCSALPERRGRHNGAICSHNDAKRYRRTLDAGRKPVVIISSKVHESRGRRAAAARSSPPPPPSVSHSSPSMLHFTLQNENETSMITSPPPAGALQRDAFGEDDDNFVDLNNPLAVREKQPTTTTTINFAALKKLDESTFDEDDDFDFLEASASPRSTTNNSVRLQRHSAVTVSSISIGGAVLSDTHDVSATSNSYSRPSARRPLVVIEALVSIYDDVQNRTADITPSRVPHRNQIALPRQ